MKNRAKILSGLLSASMVLSLVPTSAFAETVDYSGDYSGSAVVEDVEGDFDNYDITVQINVDSEGTITDAQVTGVGEAYSEDNDTYYEWAIGGRDDKKTGIHYPGVISEQLVGKTVSEVVNGEVDAVSKATCTSNAAYAAAQAAAQMAIDNAIRTPDVDTSYLEATVSAANDRLAEINDLIAEADSKTADTYTDETWEPFSTSLSDLKDSLSTAKDALDSAAEVLEAAESQESVDSANEALNEAFAILEDSVSTFNEADSALVKKPVIETMSSVTIGGVSYYYTDTDGDDEESTTYRVSVTSGRGPSATTTNYDYTKADLTQDGESTIYYIVAPGATALSGTLYGTGSNSGTFSTYRDFYGGAANEDPAYDAVSSATGFSSYHAKDIASVVTFDDSHSSIIGFTTGKSAQTVDADAYVKAVILKTAGKELTSEQEALANITLKQNPTVAPSTDTVSVSCASASFATSRYGDAEFAIVPDDSVSGYTWSEYWDKVYAATISDGSTTVGALPWIDLYGEASTSGAHYNKIELALNNGTSVGANAAEVSRYAAFYDSTTGNIKAGTYTITVYADGYTPLTATVTIESEAMQSTTIGGVTYYYADTTDDDENMIYTASVTTGRGPSATTTVYNYKKSDLKQDGDTGLYYIVAPGSTDLADTSDTLYGTDAESGTTTDYKTVYGELGVSTDDPAYDAVSSATGFSSFHAKDISSTVTYGTDGSGNKVITGLKLGKDTKTVNTVAYVEASIVKASGAELTPDQEETLDITLNSDPTKKPAEAGTTVTVTGTGSYTTSRYGDAEFAIVPDDTAEGYTWSNYWNNVYAATVSNGETTVGAVHWIDLYGEASTSGAHYNKVELALNNGTSVGANAAEVSRYAAFYDDYGHIKPGTYTITVYSDGYTPLTVEVEVPEEAMSSTTIGGVTYYYADTTDDNAATIYTASVTKGRGPSATTTVYTFTKSDLTQDGDSNIYYTTVPDVTPLDEISDTLYGTDGSTGTATNYKTVYGELGASTDDPAYDAVSSATNFSSFHAKDISSTVTFSTDDSGNKTITGLTLKKSGKSVNTVDYVNAYILQAAGAELSEEQQATLAITLNADPTTKPADADTTVTVTGTGSYSTSRYGDAEFVIVPDDTAEGYVWSNYWNSVYGATVSDGTTTVGAVHWIDLYGEASTSGAHYNKVELALNNGTSVGANAAEVSRFAPFYDENTGNIKAGTYTVTVYADGYTPLTTEITVASEAMQSTTIGGVTYYYADTTDDDANMIYTASVTTGRGPSATTTVYNYKKSDLKQDGETGLYYIVAPGSTDLVDTTDTLYGTDAESGTETNYKTVYGDLGVSTDDPAYDAVSSATGFSSFHAKDISSTVTYGTDADGNKAITGLKLGKDTKSVDSLAYVEASIVNASGADLTDEQKETLDITLNADPTKKPAEAGTTVTVTGTGSYTTSRYGDAEFAIVPDDTAEGYTWSNYWNNVYAATVSNGETTVGAVHWIDLYGEASTSGAHYNKVELALNNGTSVGANAAEVSRYAAFYDDYGHIKPGTYTITVYSDGYTPLTVEVEVPEEAMSSTTIGGVTYYYADTTDDNAATIYTASVTTGRGPSATTTVYTFTKSDLTQDGDSNIYYTTVPDVTPLDEISDTLYGTDGSTGTATNYKTVYGELGASTDDPAYDAVSSATNFSSFHAKDISSTVTFSTDDSGNKTITGLTLKKSGKSVNTVDYVNAYILQAAGAELSEEQQATLAITLNADPTKKPADADTTVTVTGTGSYSTSRYGDSEFVIVPDDTAEGYVWSN